MASVVTGKKTETIVVCESCNLAGLEDKFHHLEIKIRDKDKQIDNFISTAIDCLVDSVASTLRAALDDIAPLQRKVTPSVFEQEMLQTTEDRLSNTMEVHPPRILEWLDMTKASCHKISRHVKLDHQDSQYFHVESPESASVAPGLTTSYEVVFTPQENKLVSGDYLVEFRVKAAESGWNDVALRSAFLHGLNPHLHDDLGVYAIPASLDGLIDHAVGLDNQYRKRAKERGSSSRLSTVRAPLTATDTSGFDPVTELMEDYHHQLVFATDRERFEVPIHAIGPRAILDFRDEIHLPVCPVKASTAKTQLVRNIGNSKANFKLYTKRPFVVTPSCGTLDVLESMQVTVHFHPTEVGDHMQDLLLRYHTGEDVYIGLYGSCEELNVHLKPDCLYLTKTYISLESVHTVSLTNSSDTTLQYFWTMWPSQQEEDQHSLSRQMSVLHQEEGGKEHSHSGSSDPTARSQSTKDHLFALPHCCLTVEPKEGEIPPNFTRYFRIVFKPEEANSYEQIIYCNVTGHKARLPLVIKGEGLGPKLELKYSLIDMKNIVIGDKANFYEVTLLNTGLIDAPWSMSSPDTTFGHCFSFSPEKGVLCPAAHQTVKVTFCSSILGTFSEDLSVTVTGEPQPLSMTFRGCVIAPPFSFNVSELSFGDVAFGFPQTLKFTLFNTSFVPMTFALRVLGDGQGSFSVNSAKQVSDMSLTNWQGHAVGDWNARPAEFTIEPAEVSVRCMSDVTIKVTLCSNTVKEYRVALDVDVKDVGKALRTLPITARCIVPKILVETPVVDFRRCFLNHPSEQKMRLNNPSSLPACYGIQELGHAERLDLEVHSPMPRGVILPGSFEDVPVILLAKAVGRLHHTLSIAVFGSLEPPLVSSLTDSEFLYLFQGVALTCIGQGPVVFVQSKQLLFGNIPVLTDISKTLHLTNQSPIPAHFTTNLSSRWSFWHTEPREGEIPPESRVELQVVAHLKDTLHFEDRLMVSIQDGQRHNILLTATGTGTSVISDKPFGPRLDLGTYLSHGPCEYRFTLTNCGQRVHLMHWKNDTFGTPSKTHKGSNTSKRPNLPPIFKQWDIWNCGLPHSSSVQNPIFSLSPSRVELFPGCSVDMVLTGYSDFPKDVCERLVCNALIGNERIRETIMSVNVSCRFVAPVLSVSSKRLNFYIKKVKDKSVTPLYEKLVLKNVSSLSLSVKLSLVEPFSLCEASGDYSSVTVKNIVLGDNSQTEMWVCFNPTFYQDRVSRIEDEFLEIDYLEHPHHDRVELHAEVHYPNLHFSSTLVDFGYVFHGTETWKSVTITNCSPLPVSYSWSFVTDTTYSNIRIRSNPMPLYGYGGNRLCNVGTVELTVRYKIEAMHDFAFQVATHGENVMEYDLFYRLGFAIRDSAGSEWSGCGPWNLLAPVDDDIVVWDEVLSDSAGTGELTPSSVEELDEFSTHALPEVVEGGGWVAEASGPISDTREAPDTFSGHVGFRPEMGEGSAATEVTAASPQCNDGVRQKVNMELPQTQQHVRPSKVPRQVLDWVRVWADERPKQLLAVPQPVKYRVPLRIVAKLGVIFDVLPIHGDLQPGKKQQVRFSFFSPRNVSKEIIAQCHVEDGPTYELRVRGEASEISSVISYHIDDTHLDFGKQLFHCVGEVEVTLKNTGKAGFHFSITQPQREEEEADKEERQLLEALVVNEMPPDTQTQKYMKKTEVRPGLPVVIPAEGFINAGTEQRLRVLYLPGIPDVFEVKLKLQVAFLPPQDITLTGVGVFPRIRLNLPQKLSDECYTDVVQQARAALETDRVRKEHLDLGETTEANCTSMYDELFHMEVERLLVKENAHPEPVNLREQRGSSTLRFQLPEYVLDFGYVIASSVVSHIVNVTNTGSVPVSFGANCKCLAGTGFTAEFERVKNLPCKETRTFRVKFDPQSANLMSGAKSIIMPIQVAYGPMVQVRLCAVVAMPSITVSSDVLEFDMVQCGMCQLKALQLLNPEPVDCQWSIAEEVKPALTVYERKKGAQKPQPSPVVFEMIPCSGVLSPGERINVHVKFSPLEGCPYKRRLGVHVAESTKQAFITAQGQGILPHLEFCPSELELGPCLPASTEVQAEVIVKNPCSVPIEFYSLDFDKQYLKEEKILRLMQGYDDKNKLLLPPRQPGESLPAELLDYYETICSKHDIDSDMDEEEAAKEDTKEKKPKEGVAHPEDPSSSVKPVEMFVSELTRQGSSGRFEQLEMTPVFRAIGCHMGFDLSPEGLAACNCRGIAIIVYGAPLIDKRSAAATLGHHYGAACLSVDAVVTDVLLSGTSAVSLTARQLYDCAAAEYAQRKTEESFQADENASRSESAVLPEASDPVSEETAEDSSSHCDPSTHLEMKQKHLPSSLGGDMKILGTLLSEQLLADILAERFQLSDCYRGIVIDNLESAYTRSAASTLQVVLKALRNRRHIYLINLSDSYEALNARKTAQIQAEEALQKEIAAKEEQWLEELDDYEYDALQEEDRWYVIEQYREKLRQQKLRELEQMAKKQEEKRQQEEMKRLREEDLRKKSKKGRKDSKEALRKKNFLEGKQSAVDELQLQFIAYEQCQAQVQHILHHWDRAQGLLLVPLPSKKASPGSDEPLVEKQSPAAGKRNKKANSKIMSPLPSHTAARAEGDKAVAKLSPLGIIPHIVLKVMENKELSVTELVKGSTLPPRDKVLDDLGIGPSGPPIPAPVTFSIIPFPKLRKQTVIQQTCFTFLVPLGQDEQEEEKKDLEEDLLASDEGAVPTPSKGLGNGSIKDSAMTKNKATKGRESQRSKVRNSTKTKAKGPDRLLSFSLASSMSESDEQHQANLEQKRSQSLTTFRWVVPANGKVVLKIWFYSDSPGKFEQTFSFELVGTQRLYKLICRGVCTYPSICKDYMTLFTHCKKVTQLRDGLQKAYVIKPGFFEFGLLLCSKTRDRYKENRYPENALKLVIYNNSDLEAVIQFHFQHDGQATTYLLDPPTMTLKADQKQMLTVWAYPTTPGQIKDSIVCMIKDSPEPVIINLSCWGVRPELELESNHLHFDRILVNREDRRSVKMHNKTGLPVSWRLHGLEELGDEFHVTRDQGAIPPNSSFPLSLEFRSKRPCIKKKTIRLEVSDMEKIVGVMQTENIQVTAEAYDIAVDIIPDTLDFGTLKVFEETTLTLKMKNLGRYPVKEEGETIHIIRIKVSVQAVFTSYEITPVCDINFGPLSYGSKKSQGFIIQNSGIFETTFNIYRMVTESAIPSRPGVSDSDMGGPGNILSGRPTETGSEVRQEASQKDMNLRKNRLVTGVFSVSPCTAVLQPGFRQLVTVECVALQLGNCDQTLLIDISGRNPSDHPEGIPYRLLAEVCEPGIVLDAASIFEEHRLCHNSSQLCSEQFCNAERIYVMDEKRFIFNKILVRRSIQARFKFTNTSKVPCVLSLAIRNPRTKTSRNVEVFHLSPSTLTIPNQSHAFTVVTFTPQTKQLYSAVFEATVEGLTRLTPAVKSKVLDFDLVGEGTLPSVCVLHPALRNNEGNPMLHNRRVLVGRRDTLPLVLLNDGDVPAQVQIDMLDEHRVFTIKAVPSSICSTIHSTELEPETRFMKTVYYNPAHPGSFGGVERLRKGLQDETGEKVGVKRVKKFLSEQDAYTLHKPACEHQMVHRAILSLNVNETVEFEVSFCSDKSLQVKAKISVQVKDNPYSNATVEVTAEAYQEIVTIDNIRTPSQGIDHERDQEDNYEVLNFGDCHVNCLYQESFTMTNHSSSQVVRFEWPSLDPHVTFLPQVGHLHAGCTKEVTVTFSSSEPVTLSNQPMGCKLCQVEFQQPIEQVADWDDQQKTVQRLDSSQDASVKDKVINVDPEPFCSVVEGSQFEMDLRISAVCNYAMFSCDTATIRFKDTMLYQTRLQQLQIINKGSVKMEYTWQVLMDRSSNIVSCDKGVTDGSFTSWPGSRSAGSQARPSSALASVTSLLTRNPELHPFIVEPSVGVIKPRATQNFSVCFSPLEVEQFQGKLFCSIPNLQDGDSAPCVFVCGRSLLPHYHFDLEDSDYLSCHRRNPELRSTLDPNTRVLEFNAVGLSTPSKRYFRVMNPTSGPYTFKWRCEDAGGSQFRCLTPSGTILPGKKVKVCFEYVAEQLDVVESFWSFVIETTSVSVPLLCVGTAREPLIYLNTPHLDLGELVVGHQVEKTVELVNGEMEPLNFSVIQSSLICVDQQLSLILRPMTGTVAPKDRLPLSVFFTPSHEGYASFKVALRVKRKSDPLILTMKTTSFSMNASVQVERPDGGLKEVLPNHQDSLDFGKIGISEQSVMKFLVANDAGLPVEVHFEITGPSELLQQLEAKPQSATIEIGIQMEWLLFFIPQNICNLQDVKLNIKVKHGPTFSFMIKGRAVAPSLEFSFTKFNFGKCFLHSPGMVPATQTLVISNKGKRNICLAWWILWYMGNVQLAAMDKRRGSPDLSLRHWARKLSERLSRSGAKHVDGGEEKDKKCVENGKCQFKNTPFLKIDFQPNILTPAAMIEVPIAFYPHEACRYHEKITFVLNSCVTKQVDILGQGVNMKLEVKEPRQKKIKLGSLTVGQKVKRNVVLVNRSTLDLLFTLVLSTNSPLEPKDLSFSPFGQLKLRSNGDSCNVDIQFSPHQPIPPFTAELQAEIAGFVLPLVTIEGCCQVAEVQLDQNHLSFGAVVQCCQAKKRIFLMNKGDIDARFRWKTDSFPAELSITPTEGFIHPRMNCPLDVTFAPVKLSDDIRFENLSCFVEGSSSLITLTVTGSCITTTTGKEVLHFICPVRRSHTQDLALQNPTNQHCRIKPVIEGEQWKVPLFVTLEAHQNKTFKITYQPLTMTTDGEKHQGSVFFSFPDGTGIRCPLQGTADPPLPEDTVVHELPAKIQHSELLPVQNWLFRQQRFSVLREIINTDKSDAVVSLEGLKYIEVPGLAKREYRLSVFIYREGQYNTKVTFRNEETGEYLFYLITFKATSPGILSTIELVTAVRQVASATVQVENPLSTAVCLTTECKCPDICVPPQHTIPGKSKGVLTFEYQPLQAGKSTARLTLFSSELGQFYYDLLLKALPPPPEKTVNFSTPLGSSNSVLIKFLNYFRFKTEYSCKTDCPDFTVDKSVSASPGFQEGSKVNVEVCFEPHQLGEVKGQLCVFSAIGGEYVFPLHGLCHAPKPQGPFSIKDSCSVDIPFKNVFLQTTAFSFQVDNPCFTVEGRDKLHSKKTEIIKVSFKAPTTSSPGPWYGKLIISSRRCEGHTKPSSWVYYLHGHRQQSF
ncbi:hydrocephalus-inducing protein-like [Pholidichthys leucotaenia]